MKKIISVILAFVVLLSFVSCDKDREYDEAEVLSAASALIEKSHRLNELFYGKGLEFSDEGVGKYKLATAESLEYYGISTIEDMKSLTREIFSESYSEIIFNSSVFSPVQIDDVIKSYARYSQSYDKEGNPNGIMVLSDYDYSLKGTYEYSSSMEVVDVEGEVIVVRTLVTATSEDGKVKNINFDIRLFEESYGWRLVTPTYVVYNEYSDMYDNLKK
ncbi:MAG: hypothetical protein IJW03_03180 [Clostridia bacterium]|nr:hypothetical protein [Clostridia bacterium]